MSHPHSAQTHLGMAATDYDRNIRTLIPGYEQILSAINWWLSQIIPPDANIIELGGGTGALAETVLTHLSQVQVEIWDVDASMLAVAQDRLSKFAGRVRLRQKSFTERLPECHAVIATLSLHHIPTLDAKRSVYGNIFEALLQGGVFLNGDCTLDSAEPTHTVMLRYWMDFMGNHGIREDEARKHFAAWASEDTYQQMFEELNVLSQAGFPRPEVYWRQGPFAVYGGIKP
jgi:tRNA (cmo5U34)-methyltransferase